MPERPEGAIPFGTEFPGVPGLELARLPNGLAVMWVGYWARPDMTADRAEKERDQYPNDALWRQEMLGDAKAKSGQLIYPEFDQAVHVVPDSWVPPHLCRYMAIDPHPRTPTAMLWIGIDQWDDWWAYREIWPSKMYGSPRPLRDSDEENHFTTKEYAEMVAVLERNSLEWRNPERGPNEYAIYRNKRGGERIVYRFMDQAGKGFMATGEDDNPESITARYARYGIQCSDPYKSHASGEDAIHELLKMRHHEWRGQWPVLHIAESCKELIMEFRMHRYKKTVTPSDERELKQEASENRCHMLDILRYLATSGAHWSPALAS